MIVQFNTDHNIPASEAVREPLIALIKEELSDFSEHISRIEVHLTDQNGRKDGPNDKRCVLEARIEGLHPIAVTHDADTRDQAVEGALEKLRALVESTLERREP